jgi:hypothetical protein
MGILDSKNKATLRDRLQTLLAGVTANLSGKITLGGQSFTVSQLTTLIQSLVDALNDSDAQRASWSESVQAVKATTQKVEPVILALESMVAGQFRGQPTVLASFGIAPRKVRKVDVATKAIAAKKSAATKAARDEVGSWQRAEIVTAPVTTVAQPPTNHTS